VGGLVDVATPLGLERESEDFGLTLGHWGLAAGPYVMLPLMGPSSLRDLAALPLDRRTRLPALVSAADQRNALLALELVQKRADLLSAGGVMSQIALDRYVFVREAYLARRRSAVYDGEPPEEVEPDTGNWIPAHQP
jgi:phospholipid-binding lipoprotein MlaA